MRIGRPSRGLVLTEGFVVVGIGVALGVGVSATATRVLTKFLFGVTAVDPPTYTVVALGLLLVSAFAMFGPTRRATRSDPASILRE